MLPRGAENERPSVLALLRAVEALKLVLARVVLGRTGLPCALRAGEGPNGWGAERGLSDTQGNGFASSVRRRLTSGSLFAHILTRVGAELLRSGARCAPRCRRGEEVILWVRRERESEQGRVTHPAPGASKLGALAGLGRLSCEELKEKEESCLKVARLPCGSASQAPRKSKAERVLHRQSELS